MTYDLNALTPAVQLMLAASPPDFRNHIHNLLHETEAAFYADLVRMYGAPAVAPVLLPEEREEHGVAEPILDVVAVRDPHVEAVTGYVNEQRGDTPDPAAEGTDADVEKEEPAEEPPPIEETIPHGLRHALTMRFGLYSGEFARRLFPHLVRLPPSPMHRWLVDQHDRMANAFTTGRPAVRLAVAAPRGAAKSTYLSLILPIHNLVYARERYILIVSATLAQAERRLALIRGEVQGNPLLRAIYPCQCGMARPRRQSIANRSTLKVGSVRIDARSACTELRGLNDGSYRPTCIVLDDAEPDDVATSPRRRERVHAWYREVVEPLGDPFTHILVAGTLLHGESLLATLLRAPGFVARRYSAIVRWASRTDLWEHWRRLYCESPDPADTGRALRFFAENRDAMLDGAETLWPAKEDYLSLMEQLATMGRRAFFKERQNQPTTGIGALLDPARWRWFTIVGGQIHLEPPGPLPGGDEEEALLAFMGPGPPAPMHLSAGESPPGDPAQGTVVPIGQAPPHGVDSHGADPPVATTRTVPLSGLVIVAYLDAATGAAGPSGDDAAIAVVGRDAAGQLYLLDLWMQPALPTRQVAEVFDRHERWGLSRFGFEANCFQGLLKLPLEAERRRRAAAGRPANLPIGEVRQHRSKEQRIAALEPLLAHGWLAVNRAIPPPFIAQAEQYPHAAHDDALDALAGAVELLRGTSRALRPGDIATRTRSPGIGW